MIDPQPFFTIGITTYNRKDLLKQLLDSILLQSFKDFEIIIGNDFQNEPLSQFDLGLNDSRIKIINHETNQGELNNMNLILQHANGKYFTWQFDDDYCGPDFLISSYNAILEYNYPMVVLSSFDYIYEGNKPVINNFNIPATTLYKGKDILRKFLSGELKISILAGIYNTNYIKNLNGVKRLSYGHMALYSEYLLIGEVGLLDHIVYINKSLTYIRIHSGSFSTSDRQVDLFKNAGLNLINEIVVILKKPVLINDFYLNISAYLKSIICAVIVKNPNSNIFLQIKTIKVYNNEILDKLTFLKNENIFLYNETVRAIKNIKKELPFYIIKSIIKRVIPDTKLKIFRFFLKYFSKYTNKPF